MKLDKYKINSIHLKSGEPFQAGRINVFVGANNCGKTQLLKDMLTYITGQTEKTVILKELNITYPDSWAKFSQMYSMPIIEESGTMKLKHTAATLDKDTVVYSHVNLDEMLKTWLTENEQQFRKATGVGVVTYLNTDNRLKLAMRQQVQPDLQNRGPKNLLETFFIAGSDATEKVRECIKKIFNIDFYLNTHNLGTIEVKIGKDFSKISSNSQDAYKQLISYPTLDFQGDGMRSVLGIISAIVSVKKPIILLDEPEAFLHPPQALQLGEYISNLVDSSQQIFIATHSVDFLRGLLSTTRDATIIHLGRIENVTEAQVLDSSTLNEIITDPLLSSSRVLEGMFYKGVVATEADADAVFYQRLFQKIQVADEIHFVNAHNKQTLKKVINPYKKLGVKLAMIADVDVIREKREFEDILQITSNETLKNQILSKRDKILNYFQNQSKYEVLCQLKSKVEELLEQTKITETSDIKEIEKVLFNFRAKLKKIREDSDELSELKKRGRESLPQELQQDFDDLYNYCKSIGLFIVKVGELESWLVDYGIERTFNKSRWISCALDKIYEIEYDTNKEIWKFVEELKDYLVN